ncbi:MAG: MFS transporter [Balneolaceae bacterium]
MTYLAFVRQEKKLLSFAVSFTFFSSFGQTFLLSLFVPYFLVAFDLSNASFGTLYSAATLTGGFILPWLGHWIDKIPLRKYSMYVAFTLCTASLLMAFSWHIATLFASLLLLRLSGQGLSGHTAQTTMARYYNSERGKALSISSLGYPLGEALLPALIAGLLMVFHWRTTWALIAGIIAFIFIPALWYLIRSERTIEQPEHKDKAKSGESNFRSILYDRRFLFVTPAVLMPPFWATGLFLYQISVGAELGWSAGLIASAFIAFAGARIIVGLFSGPLIDRFSARTLFPFLLVPMTLGLLMGVIFHGGWVAFVYMSLLGATMGLSGTVKTALWAELFGQEKIGSVQSLYSSIMVFSTAVSPLLVGWLLDINVSISLILWGAVGSCILAGLLSLRVLPVFKKK